MTGCLVDKCELPIHSRGLCRPHYLMFLRRAYLSSREAAADFNKEDIRIFMKGTKPNLLKDHPQVKCAVPYCGRAAKSRGLCDNHYSIARNRTNLAGEHVNEISNAVLLRRAKILIARVDTQFIPLCAVNGCGNLSKRHGLCHSHYMRAWYRTKELGLDVTKESTETLARRAMFTVVPAKSKVCRVAHCGRQSSHRGLCNAHYRRVYRRIQRMNLNIADVPDDKLERMARYTTAVVRV